MKKLIAVTTFALTLVLASLGAVAQTRDDILKQIDAKRAEILELEKKFLGPSEADRAAYTEFLAQPDTGITRLMPREKVDTEVYRDIKPVLSMRGGGAFYSFTKKTHEFSEASNLELERNMLSVGFAGVNYGMIASLGDIPIESVSLSSPAARALANHHPPTDMQQSRTEQLRWHQGVAVDGLVFKSRVPVAENMTYLSRSINFESADVLVAFRVVRVDTDGSVVIVWKLLKKGPIPQLVRN